MNGYGSGRLDLRLIAVHSIRWIASTWQPLGVKTEALTMNNVGKTVVLGATSFRADFVDLLLERRGGVRRRQRLTREVPPVSLSRRAGAPFTYRHLDLNRRRRDCWHYSMRCSRRRS